jgi:hypothetical protein
MAITALIRYIDGGASDYPVDDGDLDRLAALEASGLTGKALIDAWISDDWGAPPTDITIRGVTSRGRRVDRTLYYD